MKKNKLELKPYQIAWNTITHHHLLGAFSNVGISEKELPKNSFLIISYKKNYSATIYINKNKKLTTEEWSFVFATAFVLLAFEIHTAPTVFKEKVNILFACDYVYRMLGFTAIPLEWNNYFKLADSLIFKNEAALFSQLEERKELHNLLFNFLNNEEMSTELDKLPSWNATKNFSEIFADNLVKQAQRTIELKSNRKFTEEEVKKRNTPASKAQRWFSTHYPLLASVTTSFNLVEDAQYCGRIGIEIAAVSAREKTIYINPLANLSEEGLKFVIAHEVLHIALGHASRKFGKDHLLWNLACDFVINHWLVEMRIGVPPEGVFLDKTLATKSADEIYHMIVTDIRLRKKMMTLRSKNAGDNFSEKNSKKNESGCDLLDDDPKYFSEFEDACKKSLLRGMYIHHGMNRGNIPAELEEEIRVVNQPAIPWQVELAKWIAERFPLEESRRTYAKPSRRQNSTPDIPRARYVRPEEEKNSRTFGVILDTSGSMDKTLLGKCLGAIGSYAAAQEVRAVRLVFCDAQTYDEGYVNVDELINRVKVKGRGGTVLQQAVNYLENAQDFPDKAPILILTDGGFEENLTVKREHAFLVPNRYLVPVNSGKIFEFK